MRPNKKDAFVFVHTELLRVRDLWHLEAEKQIARVGRELARSTAETDQKTTTNHLFQRLSWTLQKGNVAVLQTSLS